MSAITLYGITSCDTCRRARKWLGDKEIPYEYHDLRLDGIDHARVVDWMEKAGREALLNRQSRTWRELSDAARARAEGSGLAHLLADVPTLIKRPVFEVNGDVLVGFDYLVQQRLTAA